MSKAVILAVPFAAAILVAGGAMADDRVYADFPVTVKGYTGSKDTSVSYAGQTARHVLHDSLKKLIGSLDADDPAAAKARMMAVFDGKENGRAILAPKSKGSFIVAQSRVDELSKAKNLAGKTLGAAMAGMPNGMTGVELIGFWIDKTASTKHAVDLDNGYDYKQLISKFIMGAVFYNQVVDGYLDEGLGAGKKPNDKPYEDGAAYTGKEHSWDEAFGYFGAPIHTMRLTPQQVYEIAKQGTASKNPGDALALADYNKDGKVDLKSEMTFAPAYYAAGFDASVHGKDNATSYLHTITKAFLDGRELLARARGETLTDAQRAALRGHAAIIADNWERVFAEAVFKYAGSVYKDMIKLQIVMDAEGDTSKALRKYIEHWGELKGFSLALQTGKNNLGETATRLNRLIGVGPLLTNLSQVVDIDRKGNYVRDQGEPWGKYMLHMAKVQQLMVEKFGVKARNNDMTADLAVLAKTLGESASAEND